MVLTPPLELRQQTKTRSRDSSYRWIEILQFSCTPDSSSRELLRGWTSRPLFQSDFIDRHATPLDLHGLFYARAPDVTSYARVDARTAEAWIDDFAQGYDHPAAPAFDDEIERLVRARVHAADEIFRLDPPHEARHGWAWVFWEFRELVLVERASNELAVVLLGLD